MHPDTIETTRPHPSLGELVPQRLEGAQTGSATSAAYEIEQGATFGKVGGLSAPDADLVKLYAERQKDLGKPDQGVQEFASQLKTMEAPAPGPAAPAPEVKTVGPDDLPTAWGGGNMGVVGRVERPAEPAQSPAPTTPAPEVQTATPAPSPAPVPSPAPAPQQPAPSMSPSL